MPDVLPEVLAVPDAQALFGIRLAPALKNRWVAALRSGDYVQGRGNLRTEDDKFCCLGVLCDVIDPDGWEVVEETAYAWNGCRGIIEGAWADLLGFSWPPYGAQDALVDYNDATKSFRYIADYIERRL